MRGNCPTSHLQLLQREFPFLSDATLELVAASKAPTVRYNYNAEMGITFAFCFVPKRDGSLDYKILCQKMSWKVDLARSVVAAVGALAYLVHPILVIPVALVALGSTHQKLERIQLTDKQVSNLSQNVFIALCVEPGHVQIKDTEAYLAFETEPVKR